MKIKVITNEWRDFFGYALTNGKGKLLVSVVASPESFSCPRARGDEEVVLFGCYRSGNGKWWNIFMPWLAITIPASTK